MPLDAITISALCDELRPQLEGARIDKVQQPERDAVLLSVRSLGRNRRLLIAAGAGNARLHFTAESIENPAEPPMFCMLLRKHLTGARIVSISQPEHERMLELEIDTRDELGFAARKKLVLELIGRSSNLILVGSDGRIIDCMRRMDFAGDAERSMMPGMFYRMPPKQNKLSVFDAAEDERRALIAQADRAAPMDKWLLSAFSGLSPLLCRELAHRCGGDYERLDSCISALLESIANGETAPYILTRDGAPFDYSCIAIGQYGSAAETERFDSFSELLDNFYARRDRLERQRRRGSELTHYVRTLRDRTARKLAAQSEELSRADSREELKKQAELVTANIYRMKKGDRELRCEDYYEPDCPEIVIPLDVLKTPQQNAAAMYKEYNKLKAAKEHLTVLIAQGEAQLDYLNSVMSELQCAESEKDLADIRLELISSGYDRKAKAVKKERLHPQQPLRFVTDDGLEVLVGRSNIQNDELTTKLARRTDYWLHTQKVHGSHVILRCDGLEPPQRSVEQAACIAAYYSQGRDSGKLPVDYTMVRFVRKPSGSLPGKVIYTDYRTIVIEGDESLVERLRVKK